METIWFVLVAVMLTAYVVLDGFDIGTGTIHLFLARTEAERRLVLRTIGPVWDGNEVWLIAGAGTLYFAFPLLYASAFSGFYLPLIIVLWLLILRGIGIEFRGHVDSPVWRGLFDGLFAFSSTLLALFYGAALANVLRGVPLQADGSFFEALWTNFRTGRNPGILDWYTVIGGVTALVALAEHGALYVALKSGGVVNLRAGRVATTLWPLLLALSSISVIATLIVRPRLLDNFVGHPVAFVVPFAGALSLLGIRMFLRRGSELRAFVMSSTLLSMMLVGAAAALYPTLLPASGDPHLDITIYNAAAGPHSLRIGLIWWTGGMVLAIAYVTFVYRLFRGKVSEASTIY